MSAACKLCFVKLIDYILNCSTLLLSSLWWHVRNAEARQHALESIMCLHLERKQHVLNYCISTFHFSLFFIFLYVIKWVNTLRYSYFWWHLNVWDVSTDYEALPSKQKNQWILVLKCYPYTSFTLIFFFFFFLQCVTQTELTRFSNWRK